MKEKSQENVRLLPHDADGIRELDNLLPRWWVWLFWMCNLFAVAYLLYYHVFHLGELQEAAYAREEAAGQKLKAAALERFEASLGTLEPSKDPAVLARGSQIFLTYCAPCHRADGGGLVGPNLCDDYWIHGGTFQENVRTILYGVPEKGMLSWRSVLKPNEIQAVASHIFSLRGSNPPNPKPAENTTGALTQKPSEFE